ncbi:universal stress protein [Candidatus Binatus sp.]
MVCTRAKESTTGNRSSHSGEVLGSTTEYVLRNSPCPVFLAR